MSYIQKSIFEAMGEISEKVPEKMPIPPVKIQLEPIPKTNLNIAHREEAMQLLEITPLRVFNGKSLHLEIQMISDHLQKAVERSGRKAESIIGFAEEILKSCKNFYPTQAIDWVADEEAFQMLRGIKPKSKIIRR